MNLVISTVIPNTPFGDPHGVRKKIEGKAWEIMSRVIDKGVGIPEVVPDKDLKPFW